MRNWAPRDYLTSYLRYSIKTKPVTVERRLSELIKTRGGSDK